MSETMHLIGLTDAEVVDSRMKNGVNILTPPEKETLWNKLKETCQHWIAIGMGILLIAFIIFSSIFQSSPVTLIMDTFAAIALASLPPTQQVMQDMPRKVTESIINKDMSLNIFCLGGFFTVILLAMAYIMQHSNITCLLDLKCFTVGTYDGLSEYELSLFFTIFVMLQFWNMFNAKAFMTGKSAFAEISACKGFILIAIVIFFGQILIVE